MAIVTGIFPSCDPAQITAALAAASVDAGKVRVFTKSAPAGHDDSESVLNFVQVAKAQESNDFSDDITHGTNVMSSSGGTSVPGIGGRHQSLDSFGGGGASPNYLSGIAIPSDTVGNYNDAIDDGRCVAIYDATGGDGDTVATALRAAGFLNVRAY